MGSRQIVLVSTVGISVLNAGIFWREAKTKRLFSQCRNQILIYDLTGDRRKIRLLKEVNAKCRHLKKLTCKGILQQVFVRFID
jgi:hypothetical protein